MTKLEKAEQEILAVLEKYDLGGAAAIHEPGESRLLTKIDPSYSCAMVETREDGDYIRVNTKKLDLGDQEKWKMLENTANLIWHLAKRLGETGHSFLETYKGMAQELDIEMVDEKEN